ncbi:DUF3797 domain-containing protein [Enterococcus sp.]|uniref:DUF3797 domain-containing protein n=1 Tax=Enterococcus sp. TaxID=35783 RepID=UPI0028457B91|nr:DUF3797 domain-containing protein [Enterococcus sp.]MDR3826275.1 DUF3797 domain-containing protein [Enterococcus sp.]
MLLNKSMELMKKYGNCPECGNRFIGNGQGGLVVEKYTFERWCKCGWKVIVDVRKDEEDD